MLNSCFISSLMSIFFSDFLGTFQERLEIGKNYLKESDLVKKINETLEKFLNENKIIFEEEEIRFDEKPIIDVLMNYVQMIKENTLKFSEFQL